MARAAVVVLLGVVLAGAAAAAPGDPRRSIRPADQAYARSVLLRQAELPSGGWRARSTDFTRQNPPCLVRHYSLSALTLNGEAGRVYTLGQSVLAGGAVVESDGDVFVTGGEARRAFETLTSVGLARCLGSSIVAELKASGVTARVVSVTALAGASGRVERGGFRLVVRVGKRVTLEVSQVILRRGRLIAALGILRGTGAPAVAFAPLAAKIAARMTRT